jgi:hypothetical protein
LLLIVLVKVGCLMWMLAKAKVSDI